MTKGLLQAISKEGEEGVGILLTEIINLGLLEYDKALTFQQECHRKVVEDPQRAFLIFVEHPSVLTLGKSSDLAHVKDSAKQKAYPLVETDRGGEVTAHTPGQIVAYPIFPIQRMELSPKSYVCKLEQTVIDCLRVFNLEASRDAINPGIWLGSDKICALGIRIKQRVSMHGMALNVDCDLNIFNDIVPCGIHNRGVTRLVDHVPGVPVNDVLREWTKCFRSTFSLES